MSSVRTMPLPALAFHGAGRNRSVNRPLFAAVAVFLGLLIADGVLIAATAPSIADLGPLYVNSI